MKKLTTLLFLFLPTLLFSQTLTNTLLGFQEPYTSIKGQCADEAGNVYYCGIFRGSLTVNNQLLFNGNGGDDLFLIKTNPSGAITWARKYGGEGNEMIPNGNLLKYANGDLYFSNYITYPTNIGGFDVQPYGSDRPASCLNKVDTANGNILWVKRSSLIINTLLLNANSLVCYGTHSESRGSMIYDNQVLLDSASVLNTRLSVLFLNHNGGLITWKSIRNSVTQNGVTTFSTGTLLSTQFTAAGKLYFLFRSNAANEGGVLYLQDSVITIPPSMTRFFIIKTDSSFRNITYRTLNPGSTAFPVLTTSTAFMMTMPPAADSVYMLFTTPSPFSYTLDGFNVPMGTKNNLVVMDSNLVTSRVAAVNSMLVNGQSGKMYLNTIHYYNDKLYFTGYVRGLNESPALVPIPAQWAPVDMTAGSMDTFDLNGPTRSFISKASLDLRQKSHRWITSSTGYEGSGAVTGSFAAGAGKLHFTNNQDDLWNPWTLDSNLTVIRGSLIPNSDRAEATRGIRYFSDASKFVLGYAKARTALDSSSNGIVSSTSRSDLFFVRVDAQDHILWYKRIFSSFRSASVKKMLVKNDKAYVLVMFGSPANASGYNYIRFDTTSLVVPNQVHIGLFVIQRNGSCRLLNMYNSAIGNGNTGSFDVYANGDLLICNENSNNFALSFGGNTFPSNLGLYVARLDSLGNALAMVKTHTSLNTITPRSVDLFINPDGNSFTLLGLMNIVPNTSNLKMIVTNAGAYRDSIPMVNPEMNNPVNRAFYFQLRSSFDASKHFTLAGPISGSVGTNTSAMIGNNTYVPLNRNNIKDSFFVNNQFIYYDSSTYYYTFLAFDGNGNYKTHKVLPVPQGISFPAVNTQKLSAAGNYIYASGTLNRAATIDTIQVGYAGLGDGLTIQLDSNLVARRVFRLSTIYSETISDCDVYNDSLISFAYTAQTTPVYSNNRLGGDPGDLDEDAYVGTILLKKTVIPGTDTLTVAKAYPNPVITQQVWISLGNTVAGDFRWSLVNMQGQSLAAGQLSWVPQQAQQITVPATLPPGIYVLVLRNIAGNDVKRIKLMVE